jgi:ATP-dependent DNA ligase
MILERAREDPRSNCQDDRHLLELIGHSMSPSRTRFRVRRHHAPWVEPRVVQVAFSEWTADGRLRHPSFLGVRLDKEPRDVVRGQP